jgi:glutathione peroxidase|tara:strand:+ start:928 stop:1473 length:546 start_codon:yes stop_codon:yes gene_type:complete
MKKILTLLIIMFSFFTKGNAQYDELATNFSFKNVEGKTINLAEYKDQVILIVNVASRCGFTNQYKGLQSLWSTYKDKGLIVIGVPSNNFRQEPGSNKEIKDFCETTFGIDFPITEKINIIGDDAHPFFIWAKNNYGSGAIPKWNFHKIIIGKNGKVVETFASITKPSSKKFISAIEKEIKN